MTVGRERAKYGVVTFFSTNHAIWAEEVCQARGLEVKMIPTPRKISSDCGLSLRFLWFEKDVVLEALAGAKIEISQVAEAGS
jgi:hypothetical protein